MPPFENQVLSGLYDLSLEDDVDGAVSPRSVPLTGVLLEAQILDFIAEVSISQCYHNDSENNMEVVYHFPVDNEAAVCGFEAEYEDGTIVKGVVKEKEAAKQEYKAAKRQGKQANLLESVRRDVFTLSVGNLAAGAYVKIKIAYVTTLEARDDAAAFVLPTSIAPRYIPASTPLPATEAQALVPAESTVKLFGLGIRVETACHSPILSIDSPTHAADLSVVQAQPNEWIFSMKDIAMDRDVVVLVKESESHQPRVAVELSDDGTMTGLVTFFPEIEFPDHQREFVFVVDRSGSMIGQKIAQARDALLLFLRSLPVFCTFNILGFGSRYESLFDGPVPYNDENLEEASRFVAAMGADLGGTEVLSPLRDILGRATPAGVERQVFVLTDGQVSNDKQVFELIGQHCKAEARNCRLFSVGIGQGVSRHLVSGMARAGRGTHRFVEDTSEDALRVKVLGQLKQSQQPALENVSIEWTFPTDEKIGVPSAEEAPVKTLLGYRSPSIDTAAPPRLQPTMYPSLAPPIFNRDKFLIYGIFPPGSTKPESVTVKCETADGAFEVRSVISEEDVFHGSTARKLAARAAISEYEDAVKHRGWAATSKDEALQLALRNSLASSQTSFLAVSAERSVDPGLPGETKVIPQQACRPRQHRGEFQVMACCKKSKMRKKERKVSTPQPCVGSATPFASMPSVNATSEVVDACAVPYSYSYSAKIKPSWTQPRLLAKAGMTLGLAKKSCFSGATWDSDGDSDSNDDVERLQATRNFEKRREVLNEDDLTLVREAPIRAVGGSNWARATVGGKKCSDLASTYQSLELTSTVLGKDMLWELCLLQKADGSFVLCDSFERATGLTKSAVDALLVLIDSTPGSDALATMLAIAVLRVKFPKKRSIWELQEEKALSFLRKKGELLGEQLSKLEAGIRQLKRGTAS